ncbi:hypothetical protein ACQ4PT_049160 [Festuca glaucescens]
MVLVDWIDLSSDDEDDDGPMVQEDHAPGHAAQIKVETVDLTMEEEEDVDEGDNNAHFVSPKQEFLQAARGVEQAMQPGKQVLVTPDAQEAMQPGNQVLVAAVDCMEETMHSPSAAGDAPSSFTERGAAADDRAEEATQSKHADEAAASSTMTEQDASSCLSMSEQAATPSSSSTHHQNHKADALLCSPPIATAVPFPRQFWKAGEYKVAAQASINNGQNCLRINPKFLHSNATSHKWAFGAIAELLDNAVDEVQNGATYVKIDKLKYSPGEYSLVIQDGNGFKTSTMRLGADSIIFSCRQDNRRYHAHLIGQQQVTKAHPPAHYASVAVIDDDSSATRATTKTYAGNSRIKTSVVLDPCFNEEPCKRRNSDSVNETRAQKRQNTNDDVNYPGSGGAVEVGKERSRVLIYQNKTLKAECSVLEAAGQQLLSKANELSNELREFQRLLRSLTDELQFHDGLSALQHTTPMASSSYMGVGWI